MNSKINSITSCYRLRWLGFYFHMRQSMISGHGTMTHGNIVYGGFGLHDSVAHFSLGI